MDVRDAFPLTLAHLGERPPAPTIAAFVQAVCDDHANGDIPCRAARDLARYEAALTELTPVAPNTAVIPEGALRVSDGVRVIVYGAALPEMLDALREGRPAKPRPARGWIVMWHDGKERRERLLLREEGWLLESFRRSPMPAEDAVEDDEDRAIVEGLWRDGVLTRA